MARELKYPRQWLERVPAVVFACLIPGEIRIILHPGVGLADGGAPLWIHFDEDWNLLRVWSRESENSDGA